MDTKKKLIVQTGFFENINKALQEHNKPQHEKFVQFLENWVSNQNEMKGK